MFNPYPLGAGRHNAAPYRHSASGAAMLSPTAKPICITTRQARRKHLWAQVCYLSNYAGAPLKPQPTASNQASIWLAFAAQYRRCAAVAPTPRKKRYYVAMARQQLTTARAWAKAGMPC